VKPPPEFPIRRIVLTKNGRPPLISPIYPDSEDEYDSDEAGYESDDGWTKAFDKYDSDPKSSTTLRTSPHLADHENLSNWESDSDIDSEFDTESDIDASDSESVQYKSEDPSPDAPQPHFKTEESYND